MKFRFPDRVHEGHEDVPELVKELKKYGYSTLSDIGAMVDAAIDAVLEEEAEYPPWDDENGEPCKYNTIGLVRSALCHMSKDYLEDNWKGKREEQIKNYQHLIKTSMA